MSIFIKQLIKKKLKQITHEEVVFYSKQYGFSITEQEAIDIAHFMKHNDLDPFDASDRAIMFKTLAEITDKNTAVNAEKLLMQLIQSYGLEHLF